MTTQEETRIIPLNPSIANIADEQQQKLADETWRKSIPAQVFLNYFFAINYHIQENDDVLGGLQNLPFFRNHTAELNDGDVASLTRLLHTSWSTEYALRATAELGDENFLRNALHWTFPQAYHTILSSM